MCAMYAFVAAAFWFVVFAVSFLRERRLFKNGIFLVLTLMFAGIGMIFVVDAFNDTAAHWLVLAILATIPLAIAVLAVFLVVNGITMLRREGRRPKNLLSLLAGLGIIGFVVFSAAVQNIGWEPAGRAAVDPDRGADLHRLPVRLLPGVRIRLQPGPLVPEGGFRHRARRRTRGSRVPPLLAGRLDRGKQVYDRAQRKGRPPMMITSGVWWVCPNPNPPSGECDPPKSGTLSSPLWAHQTGVRRRLERGG